MMTILHHEGGEAREGETERTKGDRKEAKAEGDNKTTDTAGEAEEEKEVVEEAMGAKEEGNK